VWRDAETTAFTLFKHGPINGSAFIAEDLFEISTDKDFASTLLASPAKDQMASTSSCSAKTFSNSLLCPETMFTTPQVNRWFQKLDTVAHDERIRFRGNGNDPIAHGDCRHHQR